MNQDKIIISRQQKTINDLKTEIIFFKDKIRYHQNKLKETTEELEAELIYWKETAEFWKVNAKYWTETAEFWKANANYWKEKN